MGESWLTTPFSVAKALIASTKVVLWETPDLVCFHISIYVILFFALLICCIVLRLYVMVQAYVCPSVLFRIFTEYVPFWFFFEKYPS